MTEFFKLYWFVLVIAAPFVGSFLGLLILRLSLGEPVIVGRSACFHCKTQLTAPDLIPLLSWLALRGRCRHCAARIGIFYPLIELAALAVALWAVVVTTDGALLATCLLGWTLLALALIDWRHFLLPDVLTLPLAAVGLVVAYLLDRPNLADDLWGAAAGYLFVMLIALIYRRLRGRDGIGQGDAKLLAAAGAWVSWEGLPSVVFIAAVSGLVVALLKSLPGTPLSATQRLPFGTFLCAGFWLVWLYGPLLPG